SSNKEGEFHKELIEPVDSDFRSPIKKHVKGVKTQKSNENFKCKNAARQFLDEEAELSEQEAENISSDESLDSENELNSSLAHFLNDETQITQVLNGK
uniref:Uncharacterized protein n=1 Tax=Sphenodon punctatus TaxID=8508 RepID=A0A8D0G9Q1_SPHPU